MTVANPPIDLSNLEDENKLGNVGMGSSEAFANGFEFEELTYPLFDWKRIQNIAKKLRKNNPDAYAKLNNGILEHYNRNIQVGLTLVPYIIYIPQFLER